MYVDPLPGSIWPNGSASIVWTPGANQNVRSGATFMSLPGGVQPTASQPAADTFHTAVATLSPCLDDG